jgi:hypothetical protein
MFEILSILGLLMRLFSLSIDLSIHRDIKTLITIFFDAFGEVCRGSIDALDPLQKACPSYASSWRRSRIQSQGPCRRESHASRVGVTAGLAAGDRESTTGVGAAIPEGSAGMPGESHHLT